MLISLILLGRTLPGFNRVVDAIAHEFKGRVTTELIDFPMTRSFNRNRNQYNGEVLLKELKKFVSLQAHKTIFVTREDLFSSNLNFVFGLAMGNACIVSTARLDPRFYGEVSGKNMTKARELFIERVEKEALHELGHTMALPHCEDKKCVMVFSNSIKDVDFKKKTLCKNCKKALYLNSEI